jgi:hypothetical protein
MRQSSTADRRCGARFFSSDHYDEAPQWMRLHLARKASTEEYDLLEMGGKHSHSQANILFDFRTPISRERPISWQCTMTWQAEHIGQFVVRQTGRKANEPC